MAIEKLLGKDLERNGRSLLWRTITIF